MSPLRKVKAWSRGTKILATAMLSVFLAAALQVGMGLWFVLGLPLMILLILLPVFCSLYVYKKSRLLLWIVAGTLVAGCVLFVDISASSKLFNDVCDELSAKHQNDFGAFSSEGHMTCNYYNEESISAPAVSSHVGQISFWTIALAAVFNLLQIPFVIVYVLKNKIHTKLRST